MKERWGGDFFLGFLLLLIKIEMLFLCCVFFILYSDGGCYYLGMGRLLRIVSCFYCDIYIKSYFIRGRNFMY